VIKEMHRAMRDDSSGKGHAYKKGLTRKILPDQAARHHESGFGGFQRRSNPGAELASKKVSAAEQVTGARQRCTAVGHQVM
jgi:hypothetical protein